MNRSEAALLCSNPKHPGRGRRTPCARNTASMGTSEKKAPWFLYRACSPALSFSNFAPFPLLLATSMIAFLSAVAFAAVRHSPLAFTNVALSITSIVHHFPLATPTWISTLDKALANLIGVWVIARGFLACTGVSLFVHVNLSLACAGMGCVWHTFEIKHKQIHQYLHGVWILSVLNLTFL